MKRCIAHRVCPFLLAVIFFAFLILPCFADEGKFAAPSETVAAEDAAEGPEPAGTAAAAELSEEYARILRDNESLRGLYGTWTGVISVILVVVTVLGVAVPFYQGRNVDKKIKKRLEDLSRENDRLAQKQTMLNSAMALSVSKEYRSSNEILDKLIWDYPEDEYLRLIFGRNVYFEYYVERDGQNLSREDAERIEKGVQQFLYVADHMDPNLEYYEMGSVFPDSIIHELCGLSHRLLEYGKNAEMPVYHRLVRQVIETVEKLLKLQDFTDIANFDQTDVFIMNYKELAFALADSYEHFGNVLALSQFERAKMLYSISPDPDYGEEIARCDEAIRRLGNEG